MIVDDFYPTPSENDKSFMGLAFTAELQSIPITTPEFTQAYWLGWMNWDKLPMQYHVSLSKFENGVLTLTDDTKIENVPVGFSIHYDNNLNIYKWGCSFVKYKDANAKWSNIDWIYSSSAPNSFYLPNMLDINTCTWGRVRLIFFGLSEDNTVELNHVLSDVPYEDFSAGNDMTVAVTNSGSYNGTFTITKDDISQYGTFSKVINNVTFNFVLAAYTIPYIRDVNFSSGVQGYSAIHPMVQVHNNTDRPYIVGITNPVQFQFRDDTNWGSGGYQGQGFYCTWTGNINGLTAFNNDGVYNWCGGFVGTIDMTEMPQGQRFLTVPTGATFYCRGVGRSDYFIVGRVLTYDEILHCLSLLPRMRNTDTGVGYAQDSSYWYGHVDKDTGEFLGELVNGSQTDLLVDWQLLNNNIADNDFTEDKIPEYVPPEEELPDAYGSDVLPDLNLQIGAIGGFITQYCMTASQVASFGSYLWANIFSIEFLQSIGTMLANDFSVNPSDILKYIVSLRCYPFDLANVRGFNSNPDTIYFGRGVVGIPSAGIGTMDNLLTTFGGENITVPRLENDFRDYEPYTRISLNIPFCGQVELTPSEVVGKNIFITYTVDFSAGTVQANVWVKSDISFIIASASGSIGANIQISASNGMEFLQKIGSTVASFVKTVGTVAAIAATAGAVSEAIGVEASEPFLSEAEFGALQSKATANAIQAGAGISEALVSSPEASSLPIHSKSVGGGFTSFSTPRAYLIVERRKYVIPSNYNHVYGKACNFTTTLDQVKGFTVCRNVDLEGFPATQDELSAIESLLTSGVYF